MKRRSLVLKNLKLIKGSEKKFTKFIENVEKFKKIKEKNNLIIGFGAPAKATTALNFWYNE